MYKLWTLITKIILYSIHKTWLRGLEITNEYACKKTCYQARKELLKKVNVDKSSLIYAVILIQFSTIKLND